MPQDNIFLTSCQGRTLNVISIRKCSESLAMILYCILNLLTGWDVITVTSVNSGGLSPKRKVLIL